MSRTYTQEEKDAALAVYVELGTSEAARQLGIPKGTLASWARRTGTKTCAPEKAREAAEANEAYCAARRARVKEKLIVLTEEVLDRIGGPMTVYVSGGKGAPSVPVELDRPPADVCKDLATTVGILIDKFRLESGEATTRSEVTVDDIAGSRERLAQQLTRIANRGRAPEGAECLN